MENVCKLAPQQMVGVNCNRFSDITGHFLALKVHRPCLSITSQLLEVGDEKGSLLLFVWFWQCCTACGILCPGPGIEPES